VILGVPMLVVKQVTFVEQVQFLGSVFLTERLSTNTPNFSPTRSNQPVRGQQPRDGEENKKVRSSLPHGDAL